MNFTQQISSSNTFSFLAQRACLLTSLMMLAQRVITCVNVSFLIAFRTSQPCFLFRKRLIPKNVHPWMVEISKSRVTGYISHSRSFSVTSFFKTETVPLTGPFVFRQVLFVSQTGKLVVLECEFYLWIILDVVLKVRIYIAHHTMPTACWFIIRKRVLSLKYLSFVVNRWRAWHFFDQNHPSFA